MGYDDYECFECYHMGCGNNPCANTGFANPRICESVFGDSRISETGSHSETCLQCIDAICGSTLSYDKLEAEIFISGSTLLHSKLEAENTFSGSTTHRVTYVLMNSFQNSNGRCTRCDSYGMTIAVLLCEDCLKGRHLDDPNEEYDCFLCDHEGKCRYEDEEIEQDDSFCDTCEKELREMCKKRKRGEPKIWCGNGGGGICGRCGARGDIEVLPFCNHHVEIVKGRPII